MKNLSFLNKIIFFINNILAIVFLASFITPFIAPKTFPILSVLSLLVPLLIFIHVGFIVYWWIVGVKKQFLLSAICVLIAIFFSVFPYKFQGKELEDENSIGILSYNVRIFNRYNWINDEEIPQKISSLISKLNPDVILFQEFYDDQNIKIKMPYKYLKLKNNKHKYGQAIYSKFKIINQGTLNFEQSSNNAIYVDILKNNDTVRIYNVHLESLGIDPDKDYLGEPDSEKMMKRLSNSFIKQQQQVEKINQHKSQTNFTTILGGDFNNTAYSWAYKSLKGNLIDAFKEAGKGFGKTHHYQKFPLRIDFILVDPSLEVLQFKTLEDKFSDHYPIFTKVKL